MSKSAHYFLVLCLLSINFMLSAQNNQPDLHLNFETSNPNPLIYTQSEITYTIQNEGTAAATNIQIHVGLCNSGNEDFGFNQNNQVVYSSPLPSPSKGNFNNFFQFWNIPELLAGDSATLKINLFSLSSDAKTIIGEVQSMAENDMDSTPNNLENCTTIEDDEVGLVFNEEPCICTTEYAPVCGSDGLLYNNACEAECTGIFIYTEGECPSIGESCGFFKSYANTPDATGFRLEYEVSETIEGYNIRHILADGNVAQELRIVDVNLATNGNLLNTSDEIIRQALALGQTLDDNSLQITYLAENGDTVWSRNIRLDYPDENIQGLNLQKGYKISTGWAFPGYIVDISLDNIFVAFVITTDEEGLSPRFTFIPGLDFHGVSRINESMNGELLMSWATSGDLSLVMVDSAGIFRWRHTVARDTPSTTWHQVALSLDGQYVYAVLTDNLAGIVRQINIETGEEIREIITGQIFSPESDFSFNRNSGLVPLSNGDYIVGGIFNTPTGAQGLEYGRITDEGELVWSKRIMNEELLNLRPFLATSDGGFLFAGFINDKVTILKTNEVGDIEPDCGGTNCLCTEEYLPVCSTDSVTYDNACLAQCAGIFTYTEGECPLLFSENTETNTANLFDNKNLNIKSLHPNPTNDKVNIFIETELNELDLQVYNLQGQQVLQQGFEETKDTSHLQIDVSNLPTGIYFVHVVGALEKDALKFIKK